MTTGDRDERELPAGTHTDFTEAMSYGDYLGLGAILNAQRPCSDEHDELLFIIIHQATELWLKLVLHELYGARREIAGGGLGHAFKMLARVARIQNQLIQSWSVLSTLTPADYLRFRDSLGHSSGLQSFQYREIEFVLGNKRAAYLKPFAHDPAIHARLSRALAEPSLYDAAIELLARRGFAISDAHLARDRSAPYEPDASVAAAWAEVYRNTEKHWDLYELAEKLVDLEDSFQQWRFRHLKTVLRIIGNKRGTGGTAGVGYLEGALRFSFFPELWNVRTDL
ncbi:tryptophan 2,3-dioxygenase [Oceanibacterium hippocampi]|uniref:Tryptophan 2,3-dioxygenase n=1 Tax=Oceanibacterium hippocampi TaxID=745714 RepID=A0A1Y5S106_9PROT|nr:tryptophan 2,3-dioxygenase [Oceanibacterium hippocampi]SLN30197.1 Tryptophan 2,3-dioxygenase [Oceanibacterium hippocampi]